MTLWSFEVISEKKKEETLANTAAARPLVNDKAAPAEERVGTVTMKRETHTECGGHIAHTGLEKLLWWRGVITQTLL